MSNDSPFRAGFGKNPPVLAGRDEIIRVFREALEVGTWSQERVTLIQGFRGVGKTVTVNALEDVARAAGWRVISETATPGFTDRLRDEALVELIAELDPQPERRVTGGSVTPLGSVQTVLTPEEQPARSLRGSIANVTQLLEPRGGLLITVDEVNTDSIDDIRLLAAAVQHAIREDREIALVFSGLKSEISNVLRDKPLTFMRRAAKFDLDLLSFPETLLALGEPISTAGRDVEAQALDYMARASRGYPFLIQLIGDYAWKANRDLAEISVADAEKAFSKAHRTMGSHVHEPALSDLSAIDRSFLAAMAEDDGPSRRVDVEARMKVTNNYFSVYRQRLIDAGMVFSPERGKLDYSLPYLRDYLKTHQVAEVLSSSAVARSDFPAPPPLPAP